MTLQSSDQAQPILKDYEKIMKITDDGDFASDYSK